MHCSTHPCVSLREENEAFPSEQIISSYAAETATTRPCGAAGYILQRSVRSYWVWSRQSTVPGPPPTYKVDGDRDIVRHAEYTIRQGYFRELLRSKDGITGVRAQFMQNVPNPM